MDDYNRGGHAKHSLTVHMIFVTKYRKKLFFGKANYDAKQFQHEVANSTPCIHAPKGMWFYG